MRLEGEAVLPVIYRKDEGFACRDIIKPVIAEGVGPRRQFIALRVGQLYQRLRNASSLRIQNPCTGAEAAVGASSGKAQPGKTALRC